MKKLTFTFFLFLPALLLSQLDTLIAFDFKNQTIDIIPPVDYDESILFDFTASNLGTLLGLVELSQTLTT